MPDDLTAAVDRLPLPTVLIGPDNRILAINAPAEAVLGSGTGGRHFITALRHPVLVEAVERAIDRPDGAVRERVSLTRDGAGVTFAVSAAAVPLAMGRAVLLCLEDLTAATQAEAIRRDFVANVSHELKTPLTALIGFIETLRGTARDDPAARERFLGIMAAEANRMDRLIGDLLSLSRVETEERVRPRGEVELAGLVRAVVASLEPLAQTAETRIALALPAGETRIPGDADQMRQVLTNVIENALKYGGAGGPVDVGLERVASHPLLRCDAVVLTVRDRGEGIDPVHIPRLTERFYRVDTHRSRERGGTGLGLAIVKHIVNRHRGRLRIDSGPGQGTTVSVLLPEGRDATS